MLQDQVLPCPECDENNDALNRRRFIQVAGCAATALVSGNALPASAAQAQNGSAQKPAPKAPRPAEVLIRELDATLTEEQRQIVYLPWNHVFRKRVFNAAMNVPIRLIYTPRQHELIERIVKAVSSGDEGFRRLARNGTWDTGGGMIGCGANFFGDLAQGQKWAWVFSGHHLTIRCDGDSEPDTAFGGPIYYGHSPDGYSQRNVFNYQTRAVTSVFEALSEEQRRRAVIVGSTPGESPRSFEIRQEQQYPGLAASELSADQLRLLETVMRDVLSPYRREDADEVMQIVRRTGGLGRIHLAFYRDRGAAEATRWHFWRLEGPGLVWNYRVLPHVHCYVSVAAPA